jgi:glucose/arabinose dehydrogenase
MRLRIAATSAAAAAVALGSAVAPAAHAASAPPLPTATNGHTVQLVAAGLKTPTSFAFGDGKVFVGDGGNSEGSAPPNGGLYVLKGGAAVRVPSPLKFVAGLAWHDGALFGSGGVLTSHGPSWRLFKWTGWNGSAFAKRTVLYVAPKKFAGFNGLGFGADGRLYVGVDVGLTDSNDHGPATTSPYVYDILSFTAAGKDLEVFASGIRQPWQMAFPAGSSSPYVTDLGQDKGAKNPPDFILRVAAGQNYGFPKCNWTSAQACVGDAKPYRTFTPHVDLMGIGLRGSQMYLSSFQGPKGKGPGGEVFSLSLHGGALKPLITGFVAPVVGLGMRGQYVYVGELTGQVFRLQV